MRKCKELVIVAFMLNCSPPPPQYFKIDDSCPIEFSNNITLTEEDKALICVCYTYELGTKTWCFWRHASCTAVFP